MDLTRWVEVEFLFALRYPEEFFEEHISDAAYVAECLNIPGKSEIYRNAIMSALKKSRVIDVKLINNGNRKVVTFLGSTSGKIVVYDKKENGKFYRVQ